MNQSRRNNAKATPQEIWTVLTFTDPACTNLNADRGWVNIQMENSKIHSCRGKRHAAADSTMAACILYTSKSPPFSWHCSWQSQRTKGATYSGFREATRSECNTGWNNRVRYFYKREQCICRACRHLVACCLAILHWWSDPTAAEYFRFSRMWLHVKLQKPSVQAGLFNTAYQSHCWKFSMHLYTP